ncbi:MAG TPA: ABC transporter permease [Ktedonobacterales bacterium]|nr:ABC transporter permease [Ktedonobacterales bacterium]
MLVPFRMLLRGALRDRISLFWAILFPVIMLIGLGIVFSDPSYRRHLLAGMLALSVLFFCLSGIAFESLAQRRAGVYKLLRATPYRTVAFVTHLTAARALVAIACSAAVMLVGMLVFGLRLNAESMLLLVLVLVPATLCFTFLGLVVGNLAQNEGQVAMLNNILTLPMLFASEAFYSLAAAPSWVKIVNAALPLGHVLDGVHAAMDGRTGGVLMPSLLLLGYTAVALALAVLTFRWDPDAPVLGRLGPRARAEVAR